MNADMTFTFLGIVVIGIAALIILGMLAGVAALIANPATRGVGIAVGGVMLLIPLGIAGFFFTSLDVVQQSPATVFVKNQAIPDPAHAGPPQIHPGEFPPQPATAQHPPQYPIPRTPQDQLSLAIMPVAWLVILGLVIGIPLLIFLYRKAENKSSFAIIPVALLLLAGVSLLWYRGRAAAQFQVRMTQADRAPLPESLGPGPFEIPLDKAPAPLAKQVTAPSEPAKAVPPATNLPPSESTPTPPAEPTSLQATTTAAQLAEKENVTLPAEAAATVVEVTTPESPPAEAVVEAPTAKENSLSAAPPAKSPSETVKNDPAIAIPSPQVSGIRITTEGNQTVAQTGPPPEWIKRFRTVENNKVMLTVSSGGFSSQANCERELKWRIALALREYLWEDERMSVDLTSVQQALNVDFLRRIEWERYEETRQTSYDPLYQIYLRLRLDYSARQQLMEIARREQVEYNLAMVASSLAFAAIGLGLLYGGLKWSAARRHRLEQEGQTAKIDPDLAAKAV